MSTALAGMNILVTRPAHQAGELAAKVRLAGGNPVLFPVLEIRDTNNPGPLLAAGPVVQYSPQAEVPHSLLG